MVVAVDEAEGRDDVLAAGTALEHVRRYLAQQQRRGGPVAVVTLVAHLQGLGDEAAHVDRPPLVERCPQKRAEHPLQPAKPVDDLGRVRPVAQYFAKAFVQGAVGPPAGFLILDD